VSWDEVDRVSPRDFTIGTVPGLLGDGDPWTGLMPPPQHLDAGLIEEGHAIPIARVQAMHEGKRRAKARREAGS
jgi:DNA primase